ncbi:MAG: sigma factor [Candidatus Thiodiazotropha sp.]
MEEERIFLDRAVNYNDKSAQDVLVKSHLYIVAHIALKQDYGDQSVEDLMQEGVFGLLDTLRTFRTSSGFRFSTLATHHVRGRIIKAINREENDRPAGTSSLDVASSKDGDGNKQLKDMIEDPHYVPVDAQLFLQWAEEYIGHELITVSGFLDGSLSEPFGRRNIGNSILKSGSGLQTYTEILEGDISLFSTSDPFERRTLFKRLLSLRTEH